MKNLIERLHALWGTGNFSAIPNICATEFIGHMAAGSRLGELKGHGGVKGAIEAVRNAFDRYTETIEDIIIEGDKVVTRYVASGVHAGQYFDLPPTGTLVSVDEISIFQSGTDWSRSSGAWVRCESKCTSTRRDWHYAPNVRFASSIRSHRYASPSAGW